MTSNVSTNRRSWGRTRRDPKQSDMTVIGMMSLGRLGPWVGNTSNASGHEKKRAVGGGCVETRRFLNSPGTLNTENTRSQKDLRERRTLEVGGELGALGGSGELAGLETRGELETLGDVWKLETAGKPRWCSREVHRPVGEPSQTASSGWKKAEIAQMALLSLEKQRPIIDKGSLLGK